MERTYSTQAKNCFIATKVTLKHHRARLNSFSIKFSPIYTSFFRKYYQVFDSGLIKTANSSQILKMM